MVGGCPGLGCRFRHTSVVDSHVVFELMRICIRVDQAVGLGYNKWDPARRNHGISLAPRVGGRTIE